MRAAALFTALLLAASCVLARDLEAGVTFFGPMRQSVSPQVTYRYNNGFGWRAGKATFDYEPSRPYDYRILPFQPLRVEARLLYNGKQRARAHLLIRVENDRRYDIHADINAQDPTRSCFGCSKAVSAPIAGNPRERFWLWYGFNGISHPIIF